MGIFKHKAKSKTAIPRNSKLFSILRGIDEEEIAKARKMQGFDKCIKVEPAAKKIELIDIKGLTK